MLYQALLKLFLASAISAAALPAWAGEGDADYPIIKAAVNPATSTVGSVVEYRVTISGKNLKDLEIVKPGMDVFYPESAKADKNRKDNPASLVPLYIIHEARKEDRSTSDLGYVMLIMKMSYYRTGKHTLPEISIFGKDRVRIAYRVPELEIKSINDKSELADIEPPLDLSGNHFRLIILAAALIALTLIAVVLVKEIRRRRNLRLETPVIVSPLEIFLGSLEKLGPERLISDGKIEEYVLGISMIFRKFLSLSYRIDAAEMTSDEIDFLLKRVMPSAAYERHGGEIMNFFHLWDISKFAEFTPPVEMLLINLEQATRLAVNLHNGKENE